MVDAIINSFDIWTDAQGVKSRGRVKSIDNISLEGVARLRELILELAVRGKLVPQNPNDLSADKHLQKAKKEINKLVKEGKLKKPKSLPAVTQKEYPYTVPKGWQFVRLNEIGEWGSGATPNRSNSSYYGGDIPWFKSGELISDYINKSEEFITELALKETSLRYNYVGDVLIAMYGATIGKTSILQVRGTTNQAVCACTPFLCISNVYLLTILKAYKGKFTRMGAGGAQPNISREKIIYTIVGLPPLEEQKRIVAKVEELMVLCDQLEAQQTHNLKTHEQLVKTVLETLTQAKDAEEVQAAWQQLLPHFDTLFCTEDSIEQLKQTILQLAVMGRLVKQDAKEEPAKKLIKKIKEYKEKLINEGKIKIEKPLLKVQENEKIFQIPQSWEWTRLGEISKLSGGFAYKSSSFISSESEHQVIRMGNIRPDFLRLDESAVFITDKLGEETAEYRIVKGDILITMTGTKDKRDYLYSVVVRGDLNARKLYLNQRLCSIRPILIDPNFLAKMIKDNRILDAIYIQATGTANQANIGMGALKNWVLPLPPLAEQQRIVVKIDELMTLCDQLKNKIIQSQEIQNTLSKTIVENALA